MKRRNWILALLLVPLFLVLAVLGAVLLIPTERVGALAAEHASTLLDREVTIKRVSLKVFPRPGVSLDQLEVAGRVQDERPVARVGRVELRPRLLPLLRRQVVIDAIVIDQPDILVAIDANSISNLPLIERLGEGDELDAMASSRKEGAELAFLVRRLEINDAHLTYHDERTGTIVGVDGLTQKLTIAGDLTGGALERIALGGTIAIDSLSAIIPEVLAFPIEGLHLQLAHDALLDLAGDSLHLEHLALGIEGIELSGQGSFYGLADPAVRRVALDLGAGPVDLDQLLGALPEGVLALLTPDGASTRPKLNGEVRVDVSLVGQLGGDSVPSVTGMIEFDQFGLGLVDPGDLLSELRGAIAFSLDSVVTPGLDGYLLGAPLSLAFRAEDLADPAIEGRVGAQIDLARVTELGLTPDSLELAGHIGVDLQLAGRALAPAETRVDGSLGFRTLEITSPALQEKVEIDSGLFSFADNRVDIDDLVLRLGTSDLRVGLRASEWLGLVLGDTLVLPNVNLAVHSRLLDLDALLGPPDSLTYGTLLFARMAERPIGDRRVEEVAEELGLGLPAIPPMHLDGEIRIGELRREVLVLNDLFVHLTAAGEVLELQEASFDLFGGGINLSAEIGMPVAVRGDEAEIHYPVDFSFQVEDIGAAPFLDRFTPFRDHLSGSMKVSGSGSATLDEYLLPLRETVSTSGSIDLTEGRLVNWPALRRFGEHLSLADFDTLTFQDWTGRFSISGPRIILHETTIGGGELGIRAAGELDFNGTLDLGATVDLPARLARQVRGEFATRLASAVAAEDGSIPIGVKVTGSATSPKLELDLSSTARSLAEEARKAAAERARAAEAEARERAEELAREKVEEVEAQAREKVEEKAREATQRVRSKLTDRLTDRLRPKRDSVPPPDSVPQSK